MLCNVVIKGGSQIIMTHQGFLDFRDQIGGSWRKLRYFLNFSHKKWNQLDLTPTIYVRVVSLFRCEVIKTVFCFELNSFNLQVQENLQKTNFSNPISVFKRNGHKKNIYSIACFLAILISVGEFKNMCAGIGGTTMKVPETGGVVEPKIPIQGLALGK